MSKLDKRRKGVYGPPLGKKFIIFVDDINLPAMDPVGSKGAIELLRQMMDHKIWYDNKELFSMKIVDTGVIAAIRPPQGDNDKMCGRFMRHFNTIYIDHFDDTTVSAIFSRIVLWHLDTKGFSKEFDPCIEQANYLHSYSKEIFILPKLRFNFKRKVCLLSQLASLTKVSVVFNQNNFFCNLFPPTPLLLLTPRWLAPPWNCTGTR